MYLSKSTAALLEHASVLHSVDLREHVRAAMRAARRWSVRYGGAHARKYERSATRAESARAAPPCPAQPLLAVRRAITYTENLAGGSAPSFPRLPMRGTSHVQNLHAKTDANDALVRSSASTTLFFYLVAHSHSAVHVLCASTRGVQMMHI